MVKETKPEQFKFEEKEQRLRILKLAAEIKEIRARIVRDDRRLLLDSVKTAIIVGGAIYSAFTVLQGLMTLL